MEKTSWSNRIVYISDDVVYKVPKINYDTITNIIKDIIIHWRIMEDNKIFFRILIQKWFIANNLERKNNERLTQNWLNSIISKIKFSIPYILNIHEKCQVIKNVWWNLLNNDMKLCIQDKKLYHEECHTFANRDNYWIINWKIVILDYGWEHMLEIFEKYWENIKNWFDRSSLYYVKIEQHWNLLNKTQQEEVKWILDKKYDNLEEKLQALIYVYDIYFKKYE